jgi:hypothetical protein
MLVSSPLSCFSSRVVRGLFPLQGGGHGNLRSVGDSESLVAKPFNAREAKFYEQIQRFPLSRITPKYFGSTVSDDKNWLLLANVTRGMTSPCVADLKLGTRSFEVTAPAKKQASQLSHTLRTTTRSHGIRLVDVCLRSGGAVIDRWNRREGRRLSPEELRLIVNHFIGRDRKEQFCSVVESALDVIRETYSLAPKMRLYSASALICFDGDVRASATKLWIIDFGHAYLDIDAEGGNSGDPSFDDNSVMGLESLLTFARRG